MSPGCVPQAATLCPGEAYGRRGRAVRPVRTCLGLSRGLLVKTRSPHPGAVQLLRNKLSASKATAAAAERISQRRKEGGVENRQGLWKHILARGAATPGTASPACTSQSRSSCSGSPWDGLCILLTNKASHSAPQPQKGLLWHLPHPLSPAEQVGSAPGDFMKSGGLGKSVGCTQDPCGSWGSWGRMWGT